MRSTICLLLLATLLSPVPTWSQSGRSGRSARTSERDARRPPIKETEERIVSDAPLPADAGDASDDEVIDIETNLITVPVSVIERNGRWVPDLAKADFRLYENGVEQRIEFFAAADVGFTVAIVLDTSGSTLTFRRDMQAAANAFVEQMRPDDRAMIVAFDSRVRVLAEPTGDHGALRSAIGESGRLKGSTALFDAVDVVLQRFERIEGRKAMILFTDGMDNASRKASPGETVRNAEEGDVLIYPVQYDPATFDPFGGNNGGNNRLPPDPTQMPQPFPQPYPRRRRYPQPYPPINIPGSPFPRTGRTGGTPPIINLPGGTIGIPGRMPPIVIGGGSDSVADAYLNDLADKTGARLYRANRIDDISASFAAVADELRHQYSLGYYPADPPAPGERRQIKVRVDRANTVARARENYVKRAPRTEAVTQPTGTKKLVPANRRVAQSARPSGDKAIP